MALFVEIVCGGFFSTEFPLLFLSLDEWLNLFSVLQILSKVNSKARMD